nr:Chain B, 9-mer peptide from Zinc finger protein 217 [synthetic construct]
RRTGAPPAL